MGETLISRVQYILDALLLLLVELLHSFAGLALRPDSSAAQVASVVTRSQDLLDFNAILARVVGSRHFNLCFLRVIARSIVDDTFGLVLLVWGPLLPELVLVWS